MFLERNNNKLRRRDDMIMEKLKETERERECVKIESLTIIFLSSIINCMQVSYA